MTRAASNTSLALAALTSVLACTGCTADGLSVPYDQVYVACETNADCPSEAPLCHLHRFRDRVTDGAIIEVRQCTRRCTAGTRSCFTYDIHLFEGMPANVVGATCAGVDDEDIYDFSTNGFEFVYPEGYCFHVGMDADARRELQARGLYRSDCATLGTEPRAIITDDQGWPGAVCIPPPESAPPRDGGL